MKKRPLVVNVIAAGPFLLVPSPAAAADVDAVSGTISFVLGLGILAIVLAAIAWFFQGPAKRANEYVTLLGNQITSVEDQQLFWQMYRNKGPKDVVVAWFLNLLLSPTIAYLYLGKWALAAISLLTLQGVGFWWLYNIFSMPSQVGNLNRLLAEQAITELRLARPNFGVPHNAAYSTSGAMLSGGK